MNAANPINKNDVFIQKLTQIVLENLNNEQFGVAELSNLAGISRSHLHRKIHLLKNQSVSQFIREIRLREACKLLKYENLTASEVAYRVGFSNPSYFSKVFSESYGISPGAAKNANIDSLDMEPLREEGKVEMHTTIATWKIAVLFSGLLFTGLLILLAINKIDSFKNESEKSLAVLPLLNLTGSSENDYFVDGMHNALIGELGQIGSLRVISRTSTVRYKDKEMLLTDIAEELGVNIIVEGSVTGAGDSVRILLQVIDVEPEERHLFSKEYEDDLSNVIKLQMYAAKDISESIDIKLTKNEKLQLDRAQTVNPEIYKAYLRGMYYAHQGTRESFETGIRYLHEAIKKDPGDPLAYAGLALVYATKGHGQVDSEEAFEIAVNAADKAIKLDPSIDEAYTALSILYLYNVWDWPKTQEYFENAIRNNSSNVLAHAHYAWYHVLFNDYERAIYHAKKAVMLQPFSASFHAWLSILYFRNGQFVESEHYAKKALALKENCPYGNLALGWIALEEKKFSQAIAFHEKLPDWSYYKVLLGQTYVKAGQKDKALEIWEELQNHPKKVNPCHLGMMAAYLGFTDKAFELLNKAFENKIYPITYIEFYPCAENIRNDPRYNELLLKMNLPPRRNFIATK